MHAREAFSFSRQSFKRSPPLVNPKQVSPLRLFTICRYRNVAADICGPTDFARRRGEDMTIKKTFAIAPLSIAEPDLRVLKSLSFLTVNRPRSYWLCGTDETPQIYL